MKQQSVMNDTKKRTPEEYFAKVAAPVIFRITNCVGIIVDLYATQQLADKLMYRLNTPSDIQVAQ